MPTLNENLSNLYLSIEAMQSSAADALTSTTAAAQQASDIQKQAAQIQGDIGRAVVNTRDYAVSILRSAGVMPYIIDKISSVQAQTDDKGNYLRDSQNNFIIR